MLDAHTLKKGDPIYAIDVDRKSVAGTFSERHGDLIVMLTYEGRERIFESRYVTRDLWADLRDLP